jgi:hypothetical protein
MLNEFLQIKFKIIYMQLLMLQSKENQKPAKSSLRYRKAIIAWKDHSLRLALAKSLQHPISTSG